MLEDENMAHQPYQSWMQALLDGQLDLDSRQQLEVHLSGCRRCQGSWAGLSAVERLLRSEPMVGPRPGFSQRFSGRLAERRSRPRLVWGGLALGLGAVAASALVLPVALGLVFSLVRAAQQPAAALALFGSINATAGLADTVFDAVYIAARALIGGTIYHPLAWAAAAAALALTAVWLYVMRRLVPRIAPEGMAR
jgi:anti-sigma factor RsiW